MLPARQFTFGPVSLDAQHSFIRFSYFVDFTDKTRAEYTDVLEFPGVTHHQWDRLPAPILSSIFESLSIMLGINYWKLHCAPLIFIEGFELTEGQAKFWNELYTKGLGEFFYRSGIDFRGLVNFPYNRKVRENKAHHLLHGSQKVLLLNGGGKDSIVAAETLKERGVSFDLLVVGSTRMQYIVSRLIDKNTLTVRRRRDPAATIVAKQANVQAGFPTISMFVFIGVLTAMIHEYRYIILGNELSADIGNTTYLGLEINHQWSKSLESETLIQEYISRFISPDIIHFSLLRQFSEIEMVRRFVPYQQYFNAFSSCNMNFFLPRTILESGRLRHAFWCNRCPKCVFMFACLTAFLPKQVVVDIFGTNLHADPGLIPIYEELLGLKRFKPFECVGTSEEMIVAMNKTRQTGAFASDAALEMFKKAISLQPLQLQEMEQRVLSSSTQETMPKEFASNVWNKA
ncbi:MAG: hypothetical protein Q8Q41_02265 [bacterium]|nr:hypothetical protein [bacterium]